ncbi:MAG: serine hydrolase domain-containing protein [Gammaproteobacteria bacterium]
MHRLILTVLVTFSLLGLCAAANGQDKAPDALAFDSGLRKLKQRDDPEAKRWPLSKRMQSYGTPGVAVAVLKANGEVDARGYGVLQAGNADPVTKDTVFSVGSVSKIVNAALVLRLVQEGTLDLDADINGYLKRWQVPANEFAKAGPVTLRHLLSHTSGFSQHGFGDFKPGAKLPSALDTLNGTGPATHPPVTLLFEPGTQMKYSGGGITVAQVIVEDVTDMDYEAAARKYVFDPLGMSRSTFVNPLPEQHGNIARAHNKRGRPRAKPRGYEAMPEMAASGLWASAQDLGVFLRALLSDEAFLEPAVRADMFRREANSWHGLGPRVNGDDAGHVIHHGGANDSYRAWLEGHPATGEGLVILTNGADGREMGYEIRIELGAALGWPIRFPNDFGEPQ